MRFIGTAAAAKNKRIFDNFNRITGQVLGTKYALGTTTVGGKVWDEWLGKWFADGSVATTETPQANYPVIATVDAGSTNMVASVATSGPGTGVVFWYVSGGTWYAAVNTAVQNSYIYGCQQGCNYCSYQSGTTATAKCGTAQSGTYCGYTSTAGYCQNGGSGPCFGGSVCTQGSSCSGFVTGSWINGTYSANTCYFCDGGTWGYDYTPTYTSGYNCSACGSYEYGCQTGYYASYYFTLLKSVNGTVSVLSSVSVSAPPVAIKVSLLDKTVTATAYTDSAMTNQLGSSLTATESGSNVSNNVGIIMVATAYPSPTVDNFSAQP